MSICGAAKELKIPPGYAQTWYKEGQKSIENGEDLYLRKPGSGTPVGRPLIINSEQRHCFFPLYHEVSQNGNFDQCARRALIGTTS